MDEREISVIVDDLVRSGCEFEHGGPNWVRIIPPPPISLLLEITGRGDELDDYLMRSGLVSSTPLPDPQPDGQEG